MNNISQNVKRERCLKKLILKNNIKQLINNYRKDNLNFSIDLIEILEQLVIIEKGKLNKE